LDAFFNDQNKDEVKNVLKKLEDLTGHCDISGHICDMVKNIIKQAETSWTEQPQVPTTSSIKNPYQNNGEIAENLPPNQVYYDTYNSSYPIQEMYVVDILSTVWCVVNLFFIFLIIIRYDFGGDEFDEEVCNDFENFLRNLPPENS